MSVEKDIPQDKKLDVTWIKPWEEPPLIHEGSFRETTYSFLLRMGFPQDEIANSTRPDIDSETSFIQHHLPRKRAHKKNFQIP